MWGRLAVSGLDWRMRLSVRDYDRWFVGLLAGSICAVWEFVRRLSGPSSKFAAGWPIMPLSSICLWELLGSCIFCPFEARDAIPRSKFLHLPPCFRRSRPALARHYIGAAHGHAFPRTCIYLSTLIRWGKRLGAAQEICMLDDAASMRPGTVD